LLLLLRLLLLLLFVFVLFEVLLDFLGSLVNGSGSATVAAFNTISCNDRSGTRTSTGRGRIVFDGC
jgi:hypothetical protein